MSTSELLGVLLLLGLVAFIVFAFRQGLRVKPDDRQDRSAGVQELRAPVRKSRGEMSRAGRGPPERGHNYRLGPP